MNSLQYWDNWTVSLECNQQQLGDTFRFSVSGSWKCSDLIKFTHRSESYNCIVTEARCITNLPLPSDRNAASRASINNVLVWIFMAVLIILVSLNLANLSEFSVRYGPCKFAHSVLTCMLGLYICFLWLGTKQETFSSSWVTLYKNTGSLI